jgi:hypothetical protein
MKLSLELCTFDHQDRRFSGPCTFFTAEDSVDFFDKAGFDGKTSNHPDGMYGWGQLLNAKTTTTSLACPHIGCFHPEPA